jgi:multicomponent Na+:H+ antiporter subunit A
LGDFALVVAVLAGFIVALIAPSVTRRWHNAAGWLVALLPLALTLYFAAQLPTIARGDTLTFAAPWVAELGLAFSFRADGLGVLFALLISGIGALVMIYAGGYLHGNPFLGRFYAWLLVFMASMLGVVLADNVLLLFVFWELTSISSYILIGFEHENEKARAAALQAMLVTGAGGLAMLAGLLLLGQVSGSLELSTLLTQGDALRASPLYPAAVILILLGAFAKSAQFPFHFWLPNAMQAPTPVSAYLHSATMVKAGVYLLARLNPALGGTDLWLYAVGGIGAATMLLGGYLALTQTDLKRLLAYSTVSALGTLTMLIGLGTSLALKAMVVFVLGHALYKGALFLVAGAVDHETGTRDVTQLGGLARAMPITAIAASIAALAMAGVPPLFGFIAKELLYEVGLELGTWLASAIITGALFTVFIASVVALGVFFGRATHTPKHAHEAPVSMWLGPVVLAGLGLVIGIAPELVSAILIAPTVSAISGKTIAVKLALWHGITPALVLSLATVFVGVGLFFARNSIRRFLTRGQWSGAEKTYALALDGMNALARGQTRVLQSGYLRRYLIVIVLTTVALAGTLLVDETIWRQMLRVEWTVLWQDTYFYELGLAALILLATFAALTTSSRLGAVAALGIVGYGVSLVFLIFGAPDLAMTQFTIESLSVLLFVLVFYHLPRFTNLSATRARVRDAVVAILAGGLMTMFVLLANSIQFHSSISNYFIENALPLAHGRNVVNVILVDFRGLDTLGEITVLGIAALGVYALLKLLKETTR